MQLYVLERSAQRNKKLVTFSCRFDVFKEFILYVDNFPLTEESALLLYAVACGEVRFYFKRLHASW
jgi:hypothetical protein